MSVSVVQQPQFYLKLSSNPQGIQGITKYFKWREMLCVGMLQFDGWPDNYWSWKAQFQNSTKVFNLSAQEEMNLKTKWLGGESTEHGGRIHFANVFIASVKECYATPEEHPKTQQQRNP